ncbi:MAG TPA: 3-oxoacyl-[acyl-carrier-protein] reductase [Stellaceae bacterium]|jgi:3-oxoacyl-[acyl-carrier protein] reductase|nr:3-oxoacyl-[acyl-carrier-protein] reductase [Stellaceae bacterium]
MFDLTGQAALVTGASGGIGGAIARALYAQGAAVALAGTREPVLAALAGELGDRAHPIVADLADPAAPDRLVQQAETMLGKIDILVSNAGITRDTLALRMKDEDWQAVLEVNLTAGFRLIRAALRGMVRRRHGRILCVTSVVGVTGNPGQANYAASKAGIIGMAKSLAAEIASRGITVNCIAPGFVATAMTDKLTDEQKAKIAAAIPIGRIGTADDIAAAAVFLASAEAAYVTGQTLHVNGGMAMI